ncbi:probable calcium-binding protein CML41 [Impatiens glandulifera]|uniref:probable calcium-binding protein CML41 n=1 Tax=Impatiens glandulifera TaxID=253017 RepID=UPI001FB19108|nr:probable calcium-binding protein CML41 [Impatiens glandulifera]
MKASVVPKSSFGCFPISLKFLIKPNNNSKSQTSTKLPPAVATWRREELREVFGLFDIDKDGKISASELRKYFESVGEIMTDKEAEEVVEEADTDGDNLIDFTDFVGFMKNGSSSSGINSNNINNEDDDDELKTAFEAFEFERGSGRITPKGLQRVLSRLGDDKSYDECVAMIRVFDMDGDGELDFYEFHQMMAP